MARIAVFRRGERTDEPAKLFISRSTRNRLLRTGRYVVLAKHAIREVVAAQRGVSLFAKPPVPPHKSAYIPEHMPPVELPGLKFLEPQSVAWKLAHRKIDLSPCLATASN